MCEHSQANCRHNFREQRLAASALFAMQRASPQRTSGTVVLLVVLVLWASAPGSTNFVPVQRCGAQRPCSARPEVTDSASLLPVPSWFPFADVLNDWLQDLPSLLPLPAPSQHVMSRSEYEAMNDELASLRIRLQTARDREHKAQAAMAVLEKEMEQEQQDLDEKIESLTCAASLT